MLSFRVDGDEVSFPLAALIVSRKPVSLVVTESVLNDFHFVGLEERSESVLSCSNLDWEALRCEVALSLRQRVLLGLDLLALSNTARVLGATISELGLVFGSLAFVALLVVSLDFVFNARAGGLFAFLGHGFLALALLVAEEVSLEALGGSLAGSHEALSFVLEALNGGQSLFAVSLDAGSSSAHALLGFATLASLGEFASLAFLGVVASSALLRALL